MDLLSQAVPGPVGPVGYWDLWELFASSVCPGPTEMRPFFWVSLFWVGLVSVDPVAQLIPSFLGSVPLKPPSTKSWMHPIPPPPLHGNLLGVGFDPPPQSRGYGSVLSSLRLCGAWRRALELAAKGRGALDAVCLEQAILCLEARGGVTTPRGCLFCVFFFGGEVVFPEIPSKKVGVPAKRRRTRTRFGVVLNKKTQPVAQPSPLTFLKETEGRNSTHSLSWTVVNLGFRPFQWQTTKLLTFFGQSTKKDR